MPASPVELLPQGREPTFLTVGDWHHPAPCVHLAVEKTENVQTGGVECCSAGPVDINSSAHHHGAGSLCGAQGFGPLVGRGVLAVPVLMQAAMGAHNSDVPLPTAFGLVTAGHRPGCDRDFMVRWMMSPFLGSIRW